MNLNQLGIYWFTLIINMTILIHMSKQENMYKGSYRYFKAVVIATTTLTFLEMISWTFDGIVGDLPHLVNFWSNQILLTLSAVPLTVWFLYFDYRVYSSAERRRRRFYIYCLFNVAIVLVMIYNLIDPVVFSIDEVNHYQRGNSTLVFGVAQFFYLVAYMINAFYNRKLIEDRLQRLIIMIAIFPLMGTAIQGYNLGVVLIWPMLTYVVLVAFLFIERDEMMKDTLTGLPMRGLLENRLRRRLARDKSFVLVMIDLDDFKLVNDNYGHNVGDEVLVAFSDMLQSSVHLKDQVYRYAGDEFLILIDENCIDIVSMIMDRLSGKVAAFNESNSRDFLLEYSYGYLVVEESAEMSLARIIATVDDAMYINKKEKAV